MAKAISDEELQLKKRARRRLVGAIALVLLVVVFLPMILDSEPKPLNQDIAITIPPIPGTGTGPPVATPAPAVAMPQIPEPAPAAADSTPAAASAPAVAPKVEPGLSSRPPPKLTAAQPEAGENLVVQLGAFSNSANAKALQKKLQENKFKAYTEVVKSSGGERTRVRVGPFATREAAEKARDRMKALKLIIGDATVVRQDD